MHVPTKAINANAPTTVPAMAPLENTGLRGYGRAELVLLADIALDRDADAESDDFPLLSDVITIDDGVGLGLS